MDQPCSSYKEESMTSKEGENPTFFGWKKNVATSFSRAAVAYNRTAYIQHMVAQQLFQTMQKFVPDVRSVLELGPGTGFFTQLLFKRYPKAFIQAVDISSVMLDELKGSLSPDQHARFRADVCDMDRFEGGPYSLVCSSCALQWSENPLSLLKKTLSWLEPGGFFAHALPLEGSFRTLSKEGYLSPEKLLSLDDVVTSLSGCEILSAHICQLHQTFPSPFHALSHIKSFGGGVSSSPRKNLFFLRRKKESAALEWNIGCVIARRLS